MGLRALGRAGLQIGPAQTRARGRPHRIRPRIITRCGALAGGVSDAHSSQSDPKMLAVIRNRKEPKAMPLRNIAAAVGLLIGVSGAARPADKALREKPRQASFHVRNVFNVKVPKGAQAVRIWFAVPQEDASSSIRNFAVTSDAVVRYDTDSWGNRV